MKPNKPIVELIIWQELAARDASLILKVLLNPTWGRDAEEIVYI